MAVLFIAQGYNVGVDRALEILLFLPVSMFFDPLQGVRQCG
jgi:hypothetical protein